MFVKICGMTTAEAVEAAVEAGVDALGFVFAPSVRQLTPSQAQRLAAGLPTEVLRVAVMHHPTAEQFGEVSAVFPLDVLQTDAEDLPVLHLPPHCAALPVYRDGAVPAGRLQPRILFESSSSGSGQTADWRQARTLASSTQLILAGGLDADNVAAAIAYVRPWGVDVSSGVELVRGRKDPHKIKEFVARVRAAEEELC